MMVQCERCKKERDCEFYGRPADVDKREFQNGEWLCRPCTEHRIREIDEAIRRFKKSIGRD